MSAQVIETKYARYWLEQEVIHQVFLPNLVITIEVAKTIVKDRIRFSAGIIRPVLADIRGLASVDTPSRKYFATAEAVEYISAGAFLAESLISKLAGNIFIKIDKPYIPTKLFTNKDKALIWLMNYK